MPLLYTDAQRSDDCTAVVQVYFFERLLLPLWQKYSRSIYSMAYSGAYNTKTQMVRASYALLKQLWGNAVDEAGGTNLTGMQKARIYANIVFYLLSAICAAPPQKGGQTSLTVLNCLNHSVERRLELI